MKRYLVILFSLAINLSFGQASWWYGNAGGSAPAGPDTLTLTYWNDFVLLHIANTGITEDVNGVSAWQDRSGNGNHSTQSVNANKPTTDVDGNVVFDGTDDFLTGVDIWSAISDSSFTCFVVASADVQGVRSKVVEINKYTSTDFLFRIQFDSIASTSNIELQTLVDDDAVNNFDNIDTMPVGGVFLVTVAASETTTTESRVNGVEKLSVSNDGTWDTPFSSDSNEVITIGSNANNTAQFAGMTIKFIGITSRKFTPSEIATTESELNSFFTIY